ncbi:MAG: MMPL family transporter, partial [Candidatus Marinimicrobia bacterium]|nr:MMPL family transporter [Candidatus Neomarinimicrobiota bacterium]
LLTHKLKRWALNQALEHSRRTVLLTLFITVIIGSGVRFIFIDDNVMNMLPKDIDSRRIWDEVIEDFKYTDFMFIAFGNSGGNILNPEALSLAWELSEQFEDIPQEDEDISISNLNRMDSDDGFLEVSDLMPHKNMTEEEVASLSDYLKNNSNISSRILSKDGDYINIVLRPKSDHDFPGMVAAVSNITASYQNQYEFHFGGQPHLTGAIPALIKTETQQLMLLGLFIMAAILLINLRSLPAVGMVLSVIFLSALSMMGFMGWVYHFTQTSRFTFSMVNTSMPIVLLTIANSDGVHILSRFFREARKHKDVKKALTMTMNQLMLPIFLTSITTTAAFLTMVSSPIATMTGYGATIGFGILWAWILSSTYLPAVIHLKKWNMQNPAISKPSILENLIHRFGRNILNYPKRILGTGVAIVAVSSIGIWFINVEVNIINLFKPGNEIRESTLFLDREMAGSMNLIVKVEGDLKDPEVLNKMVDIQNYISKFPTVNTTFSIADVIKEMHKSIMDNDPKFETIPETRGKINNLFTMYSMSGEPDDFEALVNYEYETGLITAMMQSVSTKEIVIMADQIKAYIEEMGSEEFTTETSGMMMFLKDFTNLVVQSSINSIILSIVIILFIAWIFFRHWKFGLLSVIPLTSAVILNFGLMGWFGVDLSHFTALLTSIIIGVGVDFAIHYISEFIHYSKNGISTDEISRQVVDDVGYPILLDVFSNMGFGALIASSLIPLVLMGGLMVFAMISTSLGTLTILASVMEINKQNLYKTG